MELPDVCPSCERSTDRTGFNWFRWILKSRARSVDRIYECSVCRTLFRARWELVSFKQLKEEET